MCCHAHALHLQRERACATCVYVECARAVHARRLEQVSHAARIWLCSTRVLHSARVRCRRCATCEYVSPRAFWSGWERGSLKESRSRCSFLPWLRSLAHVGCSLKSNKRGSGIKDSAALFISDTLKRGATNLELAKKLGEVSRKWEQLNKNKSFCMTKWEDVTNEKCASFF